MALLRVRVSSLLHVQYTKYGCIRVYGIRLIQILLSVLPDDVTRRKIRLIESNAKCRHLKVTLAEGVGVFCLRPRTPYSPYTYCIRVNSTLIHREKGWEGGELSREKVRGAVRSSHAKLGRKYQRG